MHILQFIVCLLVCVLTPVPLLSVYTTVASVTNNRDTVARRQWEVQMQRARERPNPILWKITLDAVAKDKNRDDEVPCSTLHHTMLLWLLFTCACSVMSDCNHKAFAMYYSFVKVCCVQSSLCCSY
jgi:hypothetical protein